MPKLHCQHCKKEKGLKRCAACSYVWYCGPACQKQDWLAHILDCNLKRPLNTGDRIGAAVAKKVYPSDAQTRKAYGFTYAADIEEGQDNLLAVYTYLINSAGVKPKSLFQWTYEGKLFAMINATYESTFGAPERSRPEYRWLLQNQHLLDPFCKSERKTPYLVETYLYIGGSINDSSLQLKNRVKKLSKSKLECFDLIQAVFHTRLPLPGVNMSSRVLFGFVGCLTVEEERRLGEHYYQLLKAVPFDTFHEAYVSASLPALFVSHTGLRITNPFVLDILGPRSIDVVKSASEATGDIWSILALAVGTLDELVASYGNPSDPATPRHVKSVWFLKGFIETADESLKDTDSSVQVSYGFLSCESGDEIKMLKAAYRRVLMTPGADPIALHNAYLEGKLFEHVDRLTKLKPRNKFWGWMNSKL